MLCILPDMSGKYLQPGFSLFDFIDREEGGINPKHAINGLLNDTHSPSKYYEYGLAQKQKLVPT